MRVRPRQRIRSCACFPFRSRVQMLDNLKSPRFFFLSPPPLPFPPRKATCFMAPRCRSIFPLSLFFFPACLTSRAAEKSRRPAPLPPPCRDYRPEMFFLFPADREPSGSIFRERRPPLFPFSRRDKRDLRLEKHRKTVFSLRLPFFPFPP